MNGGPFVSTYYNSKTKYKTFLKNVTRLNNYKYCSSEKEEFKDCIEKAIQENFINYINIIDKNSRWKTERFKAKDIIRYKDFIFTNLEVKVVNLITDTFRNHEVVFYIDFIRQYITL